MDIKASFEEFLSLLGLPTLPGKENQYLNAANFVTPLRMLEFNLYWEFQAIQGYKHHRDRALYLGDIETAELFNHIKEEENQHFDELLERYHEIKRKDLEGKYREA